MGREKESRLLKTSKTIIFDKQLRVRKNNLLDAKACRLRIGKSDRVNFLRFVEKRLKRSVGDQTPLNTVMMNFL